MPVGIPLCACPLLPPDKYSTARPVHLSEIVSTAKGIRSLPVSERFYWTTQPPNRIRLPIRNAGRTVRWLDLSKPSAVCRKCMRNNVLGRQLGLKREPDRPETGVWLPNPDLGVRR